ncbi:cytochrome P450, putative [Ixodes scapularis]|uniref:Cytochrome P450, putative n=1 Tax=Ixodes scapularis TaxID=6945 RepID=B7PIB3_IXOSC|nr:cytochrome P450, putative [Ixodes scapularis]|eukprot:XP_002404794.1 cytochrome P450, putative [Ixodes scapularis]
MDIILALVAILILSVLLFKNKSKATDKNKILAPGPKGLPILGYMPFIGPTPHVKYKELSKTYGPIVRVRMGSTDVLVLHDVQSIKEGLNKDEVLARPPYFLLRRMGMDGVITMNGQPWLDNRRFCLHVLRDLGFGRKSMEQHIKEEVAQLCDVLQSWDGQPKAITDIITSSISNNITALVFGERFHYDDPRRHFLDTRLVQFALNASFVSTLDFLPILRKLVSYVPSSKIRIAQEQLKDVHDFIRQQMRERSNALNANVNKDLMSAYWNKINENNGGNASFNPLSYFDHETYFCSTWADYMSSGTHSVRASMLWHLLNCARDPEGVQRKLQQEVDEVVGRVRAPEWEDRKNMPYTMAVIWEMLRWRTVAPLGIIREAERDTTIGGFHVPAGTVVMSNVWALHHDPDVWEHPMDFDPTRFLSTDQTKLLPKPAALLPFSTGRRMCPGETLSMMELFIYLATLMQRFTVLPKEGDTISMDIFDGFITLPLHTQEIRFVPR